MVRFATLCWFLLPCIAVTIGQDDWADCTGIPLFVMCKCIYVNTSVYGIRCNKAGFNSSTLPLALSSVPASVKELTVTGDTIHELPSNLFRRGNDVTLLNLSNNSILSLHDDTFSENVRAIKTLILDTNDIYVGKVTETFRYLTNLRVLSLNNAFSGWSNSTVTLDDLSFLFTGISLDNLEELYLDNNKLPGAAVSVITNLTSLKYASFSGNRISLPKLQEDWIPDLKTLNLSHNTVPYLTKQSLDALDKVAEQREIILDLRNNPFQCTCNGKYFLTWLNKTKVSLIGRGDLTCAFPRDLLNIRLDNLRLDHLKCTEIVPIWKRSDVIIKAVCVGMLGILFIIIPFINRKFIKRKFSKIVESARKMLGMRKHEGYSTVEEGTIEL